MAFRGFVYGLLFLSNTSYTLRGKGREIGLESGDDFKTRSESAEHANEQLEMA